jgi:hypothetical protein
MFATTIENSSNALITVENLTISPVLERDMAAEDGAHRELCYKLDWEPILEPLGHISNSITNGNYSHPIGVVNGSFNGISGPTLD